jgi:hypothetical protein
VKSLIEANAAKLRDLHQEIKRTWLKRGQDEKSTEAWTNACREFHHSYDALAFPGGLGRAMSLLPQNDHETIEQSVRFLEADPFYFRSGYIKTDIIKHLRRMPLHESQKKRLQKVIINRIYDKARREFRWYCRLAKYVTDPEFEQQLVELSAAGTPKFVSMQAKWVLAQLKPS